MESPRDAAGLGKGDDGGCLLLSMLPAAALPTAQPPRAAGFTGLLDSQSDLLDQMEMS
jgi:hypothetical protein